MKPPEPSSCASRVRLGEFDFDPESGELFRDGEAEPHRLGPQPAHLLRLLVAKDGALLSREEIRAALWPDVAVDFDQALHFAVRQVRAALDDSAAEPRYIETLPRRGYRLRVPVEAADATGSEADLDGGATPAAQSRPRWMLAVAVAVALLAVGLSIFLAVSTARRSPEPLRLGIMPFEEADRPNGIAERLLLELEAFELPGGRPLEVIGPTTTESFRGRERPLHDAARELELDYLLNGRFLHPAVIRGESEAPPGSEDDREILAEVIRAADGAHVWVEAFPRPESAGAEAALAETLARAAREHLAGAAGDSP